MPEASISFSWATLARKWPCSGVRSVRTMDSATWCRTPAAASAARRLRPEVSKNSSTALSSNDGELVRSITTRMTLEDAGEDQIAERQRRIERLRRAVAGVEMFSLALQ